MPTYRLDLAYDGSGFHGYARQRDVRTVQGVLEQALATVLGRSVDTTVAGRTDAGVHAEAQVVSFSVEEPIDTERTARSLDSMVGDEIAVTSLTESPAAFDARFSATSRTYRYLVDNRPVADPLTRHMALHVPEPLDVAAMRAATQHLVGEHDFASLCRKAEGRTTERTVLSARWSGEPRGLITYEVTATAFCHQMVRSMVALCVEVGRGRLGEGDVPGILEARDRNAARGAAPAHGLVLVGVDYG
jgi:tRNA pseudouridine38-40 synthase